MKRYVVISTPNQDGIDAGLKFHTYLIAAESREEAEDYAAMTEYAIAKHEPWQVSLVVVGSGHVSRRAARVACRAGALPLPLREEVLVGGEYDHTLDLSHERWG